MIIYYKLVYSFLHRLRNKISAYIYHARCLLPVESVLASTRAVCVENSQSEPAHHGTQTLDVWYERPMLYLCTTVFLTGLMLTREYHVVIALCMCSSVRLASRRSAILPLSFIHRRPNFYYSKKCEKSHNSTLKYSKSLSILSIRFDKNDRIGNLGNPTRVTINSPSIRPYSVIIITRCATVFYPLARFRL